MIYVTPLKENFLPISLRLTCHMMAESDKELESFAKKLKLRKNWRHGDHYDLSPGKRLLAVKAGAFEVSDRFLVLLRKKLRTPTHS